MNRRRALILRSLVVLLVAVGVAALSTLAPRNDKPAQAGEPSPVPRTGEWQPVADYHILPGEREAWMAAANEYEDELFKDGVLTFVEYEAAVFRTLACIDAAGLTVMHSNGYGRAFDVQPGPRLSSRGVYSYFGQVTTNSPTRPAKEFAALAECKQGSAQAEFMWAQHTAPSQVDVQAMRDHMAACLRGLGATVREHPNDLELGAVSSSGQVASGDYDQCRFEAADTFEIDSLPGTSGRDLPPLPTTTPPGR